MTEACSTTTTDNISLVLKTEGKFATSTTDSFLVPAQLQIAIMPEPLPGG